MQGPECGPVSHLRDTPTHIRDTSRPSTCHRNVHVQLLKHTDTNGLPDKLALQAESITWEAEHCTTMVKCGPQLKPTGRLRQVSKWHHPIYYNYAAPSAIQHGKSALWRKCETKARVKTTPIEQFWQRGRTRQADVVVASVCSD